MSPKFSKTINAWCSYDIANSVYKLLITTVLFPIYYKAVTSDSYSILGIELKNTVLYDFALAAAFLLVAFISPILSGIADYGGNRKRFMQVFTFLGAISCAGMYYFEGDNLVYGILTVVLAAVGYEGATVFYNSFLPQIADKSMHDRISARGYSWGYVGSLILLSINLFLLLSHEKLGLKEANVIRISFLQVGFWWFSISWIAFAFLKDGSTSKKQSGNTLKKGYQELMGVQKMIFSDKITRRFLFSFFFYSMGLQTLMLVAIMFGQTEVGVEQQELIITVLLLQLVAIIGANLFAYLSRKFGNKQSIIAMLFIWLAVCFGGYFVQTVVQFYFLSAGVGLVMGGIQSQSRSTFSKLIPAGTRDTASYFSFYNFSEKIAIVLGMLSFGFIEQITGSARNSTLALAVYFIIALFIIWKTPLNKIKRT